MKIKNNILKWFLLILLIALCIVLIFKTIFIIKENKTKKNIFNFVKTNIEYLNDFVDENEDKKINTTFKGLKVQKNPDFPTILEFFYSGYGVEPSGVSYGIYYIPKSDIEKYFFGTLKKISDKSWGYKEKNSDNSIFIECIQGDFYYFKTTN